MQFVFYLRDIATGDLGNSLTSGQPVTRDLWPAACLAELTICGAVLALRVALPLGFVAALRPDSLMSTRPSECSAPWAWRCRPSSPVCC